MGTRTRKLETQGEKPDLFATQTWLWKMVPQLTLIFVTKTRKPQGQKPTFLLPEHNLNLRNSTRTHHYPNRKKLDLKDFFK